MNGYARAQQDNISGWVDNVAYVHGPRNVRFNPVALVGEAAQAPVGGRYMNPPNHANRFQPPYNPGYGFGGRRSGLNHPNGRAYWGGCGFYGGGRVWI